ncbi:MAG TPA: methyltransferase domain-containing protein [Actinomycetota bacterium]|nr:methyltransferase domain-containing protein [Actinomycetota bacterium]
MNRSSGFQDIEKVKAEIADVNWYHRIDLGDGIVTPGVDDTPSRMAPLELPSDLSGKSVLDIGAWDGVFTFEAERRGASRVLATDSYCWSGEGWGTKEGFLTASRILGSRADDLEIDVMDLSPEKVGTFDLVLFVGVLYHLRHPLLALERVASVTGDQLIFDSHTAKVEDPDPVMLFYPGTELNDDPTNWWGANPPAVEAMLRDVGFRRIERKHPELIEEGRLILHAWK